MVSKPLYIFITILYHLYSIHTYMYICVINILESPSCLLTYSQLFFNSIRCTLSLFIEYWFLFKSYYFNIKNLMSYTEINHKIGKKPIKLF